MEEFAGEEYPKTEKDSLNSKLFYPGTLGVIGVLAAVFNNQSYRRPLYSGIHRHIVFGLTGVLVGLYIDEYLRKKYAHRDAVIRHYVELHPEDFIDTKRKYKEIFEEWKPIR